MFGLGLRAWLFVALAGVAVAGIAVWHHRVYRDGVETERLAWTNAQAKKDAEWNAKWDGRQALFAAAQKVSAKERETNDAKHQAKHDADRIALKRAQDAAGATAAACLRDAQRVRAVNEALGYPD